MSEDNVLHCAGGCGTTAPMSKEEAEIRKKIDYPINWWCRPCAEEISKRLGIRWMWGKRE